MNYLFIKSKSIVELNSLLSELIKKRIKLYVSKSSGDFKKVHLFNRTSKNIARINTCLNELKKGIKK